MLFCVRAVLFCSVVSLALAAGCGHAVTQLTFRTIDAGTGHPLEGVVASCREERIDVFLGTDRSEARLTSSGTDGVIHAAGLHAGWDQTFTFTRPGYVEGYAWRSHTAQGTRVAVSRAPMDPLYGRKGEFAEQVDGIIQIKMYASPPSTTKPAAEQPGTATLQKR
jgi:hypothetical protein